MACGGCNYDVAGCDIDLSGEGNIDSTRAGDSHNGSGDTLDFFPIGGDRTAGWNSKIGILSGIGEKNANPAAPGEESFEAVAFETLGGDCSAANGKYQQGQKPPEPTGWN